MSLKTKKAGVDVDYIRVGDLEKMSENDYLRYLHKLGMTQAELQAEYDHSYHKIYQAINWKAGKRTRRKRILFRNFLGYKETL